MVKHSGKTKPMTEKRNRENKGKKSFRLNSYPGKRLQRYKKLIFDTPWATNSWSHENKAAVKLSNHR